LAKHVPKANLGFKSNLYVIVGSKEMRTAEIEIKGVKVKAQIPKFIDKFYKVHNQVNQSTLNQLLTFIGNQIHGILTSCNVAPSTITVQTSGGTAYQLSTLLTTLVNSPTQLTDVFIAVDNSTNSYTAVSEILNPSTQFCSNGATSGCQYSNFANANLSFTKNSNQSVTFIWALTQDVSGLNVPLSQTNIGYLFVNQSCSGCGANFGITVYKTGGTTLTCSSQNGYNTNFLATLGGTLYLVIWCPDNTNASYTVSSIQTQVLYTEYCNGCSYNCPFPPVNIVWSTPPNSPGSKSAYGPVTWYNALTLVA